MGNVTRGAGQAHRHRARRKRRTGRERAALKSLRRVLRRTSFYPYYKALGHYPDYFYWQLRGRPPRPPHLVKQRTVLDVARRKGLRVLVETGTYYGEMVAAARRHFAEIYSIEFDPKLAAAAERRFAGSANVHILRGSSQELVPRLLGELTQPALFWLDAGYCAWNGSFADSARLLSELDAILAHPVAGHFILVDDVVPFSGLDGAPELSSLEDHVRSRHPEVQISVVTGILKLAKAAI